MSRFKCNKCNASLNKNNWSEKAKINCQYICKSCKNIGEKKRKYLLKQEIFNAYGGKCSCCQENNLLFLTIDHIDGLGAKHRRLLVKKFKRKSKRLNSNDFYMWLKKNNFPQDNYQILCFNCNCAKHINGICPHQENKT